MGSHEVDTQNDGEAKTIQARHGLSPVQLDDAEHDPTKWQMISHENDLHGPKCLDFAEHGFREIQGLHWKKSNQLRRLELRRYSLNKALSDIMGIKYIIGITMHGLSFIKYAPF